MQQDDDDGIDNNDDAGAAAVAAALLFLSINLAILQENSKINNNNRKKSQIFRNLSKCKYVFDKYKVRPIFTFTLFLFFVSSKFYVFMLFYEWFLM